MKKGEDFVGVTIVYLCHDGKGNYLFHKRSQNCRDEQGRWDCGGGGLEFGDAVIDTLKKEIKEEYCADVIQHEFLGYRDVHRENNGKKTHWVSLEFKVLVDPAQVRIGEPHKFDDLKWCRMDELPSPLHSQLPYFLDKYRANI